MLNKEVWGSFSRPLSAEDIAAIEDRMQYLADILPRYLNIAMLASQLDDLDLDLMTFIRTPDGGNVAEITPWLIHCDWYDYLRSENISPECKETINATLNTSRGITIKSIYGLVTHLTALLRHLQVAHVESEVVAYLAAIDYLACRGLAQLAEMRLRRVFGS
jgi:hypothetical protein